MLAVVGELEAGDELGVPDHGGHALARVVVEDGQRLVGARGGGVDAGPVQRHLDQRAVVARRTLERPGRAGGEENWVELIFLFLGRSPQDFRRRRFVGLHAAKFRVFFVFLRALHSCNTV